MVSTHLFLEVRALTIEHVKNEIRLVFQNPPFVSISDQIRNRRSTPRELLHSSLLGFIFQDLTREKSAFFIHPRKSKLLWETLEIIF